jgi:photosystem II stability/assembly factor-like uncharacterized protein
MTVLRKTFLQLPRTAVFIVSLVTFLLPCRGGAQNSPASEDPLSREDPAALGTNLWAVASLHVDTAMTVGDGAIVRVTHDWGYDWINYQDVDSASTIMLGIALIDSNNVYAVGHDGVVLNTKDGGLTWIKNIVDSSQTLYGVSFPDVQNGTIIGDHGLILRTTDGGLSWSKSRQDSSKLAPLLAVSFVDNNAGTVVGGGGTILRTTDGGLSWVQQVSGVTNYLWGVSFVSATTGTVVGTKGTILHTTNGGSTWSKQTLVIDTAAHLTKDSITYFYAVSFQNDSNGIAVGSGGRIILTTNSGATWIVQRSNTTNNLYGITMLDTNRWIAVGGYNTIVSRIDSGIILTGIRENQSPLPSVASLEQNYPNPFNPATTIPFTLSSRAAVILEIYDLLGRKVCTLLSGTFGQGYYTAEWNAADFSSGVYYYRLVVNGSLPSNRFIQTRKLLLIK